MSKVDLLKARLSQERVSMADVVQSEIRNKGKTTDIRRLINFRKGKR